MRIQHIHKLLTPYPNKDIVTHMDTFYRISEFAKRVGRSAKTIRRWEKEGKLIVKKLPSGQRYFDDNDVENVLGIDKDRK